MRALIVHPKTTHDDPFDWIELPEDEHLRLDALQAVVEGPIESLPIPWQYLTFWGHDDAKGKELVFNEIITAVCKPLLFPGDFVSGTVVITGFDPETGADVSLTDDRVVEEFFTSFFQLIDISAQRWEKEHTE